MQMGLIGDRLGHSFSKEIHERLGGYHYELKEVGYNDFDDFMKKKDFVAINVTIPYKQKVIPYLTKISPAAEACGAVNCIVHQGEDLVGYNTDVMGFNALLKHMDIDVKDKNVLVLGDGGASKAVQYCLKEGGAKNIVVTARVRREGTISYKEVYDHQEVEIIINTTPMGMYPLNDGRLIEISKFKNAKAFIDVVYNPLRTPTVLDAEEIAIKAEGGLYMLVAQAFYASQIFLNKQLDTSKIDEIYHDILIKNSSVVLIGMPSSGKSTIGKIIAEKLNKEFIDTDEEVIKMINMPIKDYFLTHGENEFRQLETEVIRNYYQHSGYVISTGGGVILNKLNMDYLKQNGRVIFLDRDIKYLKATDDRPLSNNTYDLNVMYKNRLPLYQKYADKIVKNNESILSVVNQIMEDYE